MKLVHFYKFVVYACAGFAAHIALAFELSPKKAGVSLRAQPAADAAVVKILQGNERLKVISKSGLFWSVTSGANKGFVLASEVQPARGSEDSSVRSGFQSAVQGNKSEHKRARSSVMGIRGLDDAEEISNKAGDRNNPNAIQKMETRPVSKEGVNRLEDAVNKENEELNK